MQYMNSFKNKKQSQIIHQQNKNAKKKSNRWRHHKQKSYYKKSLKKRKSYRHNKNFHEWNLFMVECINHSLYCQMEDETFIERWISEQQHDEQQRRIIDHLKEKCKNQYIQQLNTINAVNNYYPFGNYVQDIYQSLTNYSNCHPTIYHISPDICVLITEYIFDPFSPNINRHVYEFNRHGQQEPKQLKYDTLPKLEDFIDYVLFSDHGIWAPSDYLYPEPFEHFSAWYAIQDYGLLNGSQCPLNIIDYEFVNVKCNNYY
eukprot:461876_1